MSNFRIHAHHPGMIERWDESQIVPGSRHVNIAARFIGLGFQCKAESIFLRGVVFAQIVHRFAQTLYCFIRAAAGIGLDALAPAPQHKYLGPQFGSKVHCTHGLLDRVGPHFWIVCRERSVPKYGMKK